MNGGKQTLWAQVVTEDTKNQREKGKEKEVEGKVKKIKRHNEEQKNVLGEEKQSPSHQVRCGGKRCMLGVGKIWD